MMKGGGVAAAAFLLLVVIAAAGARAAEEEADFCSRVEVRRAGCPNLPTAVTDGIDADALLGGWFEIGGTARYKRAGGGGGGGGVCTRVNLTADGRRGALQIWSESVVPAGAAAGRPAMAAVTEAAGIACGSASRVCRLVTGRRSKVAAAATRVEAAAEELAAAAANLRNPRTPPAEAEATEAVVEGLEAILHTTLAISSSSSSSSSSDNYTANSTTTTSDAARYLLDHLSHSLSTITSLAAAAAPPSSSSSSQMLHLALHPPPHHLLRSLHAASSSASSDASSLSRLLLYNLTSAASAIDQSLARLTSPSSSANLLLREASALLHHTLDNVLQLMVTLETQLASIDGPLSEMVAAAEDRKNLRGNDIYRSSDRTTQISVTRGKLFYRIYRGGGAGEDVNDASYGDAGVDDNCVDGLNAGVNDSNSSSNAGTADVEPAPRVWAWQIVAVEGGGDVFDGIAVDHYSALLAYACSVVDGDMDAAPLIDLLLLSRTPTLDPTTIHRLMDTAASYGIYTDDCQSPFLPTPQPNPNDDDDDDDDDDDCSNL